MTPGDTARTTRFLLGTLTAGIALAVVYSPVAGAAPDCSPAAVDATTEKITQQAQAYLNSHPEGNKTLMTAALQPQAQAAATIQAYASSNPQEYAEFRQILAPLGNLQNQCGVQVIPAQFQWAFDQFIGG